MEDVGEVFGRVGYGGWEVAALGGGRLELIADRVNLTIRRARFLMRAASLWG